MNEVTSRLRKAINWLIFLGKAENERALAELLGYTKSSFSQILNGKVPLSDKFLKGLCSLDENINEVWIKTGEGDLFKVAQNINQTINGDNNQVAGRDINVTGEAVGKLIDTVNSQQSTISELIRSSQSQSERFIEIIERLTR